MTAIPPIDKSGELKKAGILLDRWRKQLQEAFPGSREWQAYVAESLAAPYREPAAEAEKK